MEEPGQLIPTITTQSKHWTVRVTVSESIPIMTCSTGSKLKRYIFTDNEGNEIVASIYGTDVDILSPMIKQFGVYDISNVDVRIIDKKYQIVNNTLQWNIRRHTLIREVPEARPNLQYFLNSLTPFSLLSNANETGANTADIMGIIIDADEMKQVNNGRNNVQHFTFINTEKIPICVTVWDEMIASEGYALLEAARNHSAVVAKRLAIKTFDCISLSTKNSSSFAIDPPIEAAANLKAWFKTISEEELELLKGKKTSTFARGLVSTGKMKTYTITEVAKKMPTGDYWVRGRLQLIEEDQQLHYIACSNCLAKVKAQLGLQYTCFLCKKKGDSLLEAFGHDDDIRSKWNGTSYGRGQHSRTNPSDNNKGLYKAI